MKSMHLLEEGERPMPTNMQKFSEVAESLLGRTVTDILLARLRENYGWTLDFKDVKLEELEIALTELLGDSGKIIAVGIKKELRE